LKEGKVKKLTFLFSIAAAFYIGGMTAKAAEITMATWGSFYGETFKRELAEPFEKETGIKVNLIYGNSVSNLQRVIAQKNSPQIDIVTLGSDVGTQGFNDGLFEALDPNEFPNLDLANDRGIRRTDSGKIMFAPFFLLSYGILYRTDLVPFEITSWNDLWDPRLKNKVGVTSPKLAGGAFLLMMNRLANGTESNVAPGIAKVKTFGQNLLTIEDAEAKQLQLITSGEVWAQTTLIGTGIGAVNKGLKAKYIVPKEGGVGILDVVSLVKNGPNQEGAKKFINFLLAPERMRRVVEAINAAPTNAAVVMSSEAQSRGAATKEDLDKLVFFDDQQIIKNRANWSETWDREILPMVKR
jgi:putative spermidine/putrescine transport system substrate-binding protein